ncbi:MAG: radical SAM protein, partial [Methanogenium sp.]|nr:radical SAM protein [Methanogenium sp.]
MSNLLITSKCNRKCSFCFARQRLTSNKENSNISRENIRKVMAFNKASGINQLRLLGGEPSVHPEFIDIVDEALSKKFHVHVFTNGMFPVHVADHLAGLPDESISFLCNISPQARE